MSTPKQLYASALAVFLTGALPGCASYASYATCGSGPCSGDAKITADVQARLGQYPALEPPDMIHVQTLNHVVYLSGLVDTPLERQMAESVARGAADVTRVVSSIAVNNKG
ncbi:MAG TPA: BON domain-containing protein [Steroidobacteraceae bacterium]|nr:BON domain-containing protein [Steroidobacteraceae bacterium]